MDRAKPQQQAGKLLVNVWYLVLVNGLILGPSPCKACSPPSFVPLKGRAKGECKQALAMPSWPACLENISIMQVARPLRFTGFQPDDGHECIDGIPDPHGAGCL